MGSTGSGDHDDGPSDGNVSRENEDREWNYGPRGGTGEETGNLQGTLLTEFRGCDVTLGILHVSKRPNYAYYSSVSYLPPVLSSIGKGGKDRGRPR